MPYLDPVMIKLEPINPANLPPITRPNVTSWLNGAEPIQLYNALALYQEFEVLDKKLGSKIRVKRLRSGDMVGLQFDGMPKPPRADLWDRLETVMSEMVPAFYEHGVPLGLSLQIHKRKLQISFPIRNGFNSADMIYVFEWVKQARVMMDMKSRVTQH